MKRYKRIVLYVMGGEEITQTARRAIQEALNNPDVEIEFTHNGGTVVLVDSEFIRDILARWDKSRKEQP